METPITLGSLDAFGEADVREEIISPLLRQLGYRTGTTANIVRELSLRYPRVVFGRKNPHRDPPLRGRADYVLDTNGIRWTIEAKAPSQPISVDDVEQAYSYSVHPEVAAVLFCLCNGYELRVYQTNRGPEAAPMVVFQYDELSRSSDRVQNVLGPEAVIREYSTSAPDLGEPIGPGLRSVARITGGFAEFNSSNVAIPLLDQLVLSFSGGAIERNEGGRLVLYVESRSPFAAVNRFNERTGFNRLELTSVDRVLSSQIKQPTIFTGEQLIRLAEGETIPNLLEGGEISLSHNAQILCSTQGSGTLESSKFAGSFVVAYRYIGFPGLPDEFLVEMSGHFDVALA